jgi:antirestriction protein
MARLTKHGEAFAVWYDNETRDSVDVDAFEESYRGTFRSLEDYASEYLDDTGAFEGVSDMLKNYFDYAAFGRDMELGGDVWTAEGGDGVFVFGNC